MKNTLVQKSRTILGSAMLAAMIATIVVALFPVINTMERWSEDLRIAYLLPPEDQHPDIMMLMINEDTLSAFPYRSPVDRALLANTVRLLGTMGVRAIVLDILFDQPTEPAKDAALARALDNLTIPYVAAYAGQAEGLNPAQIDYLDRFIPPPARGLANLLKDPFTNTARWIYPGKTSDDGVFIPGMVGAIAEKIGVATSRDTLDISWRGSPLDNKITTFRTFPIQFLENLPAPWLKDKIVFIGADLSITDRHRTPFAAHAGANASFSPGVLVHAHGLAQILENRPSYYLGPVATFGFVFIIGLLAVVTSLLTKSLVWRISLSGLLMLLYWAIGFLAFAQVKLLLPLIAPTIALLSAAWLMEVIFGRQARQQKKFIRRAFAKYMAPAVVKLLEDDPSRLSTKGEKREMTFLFTDIANFTSFTEKTEPEIMVAVLNDYLGQACSIAMDHDGMIDKIIGDALCVIFNAPVYQDNHAQRAVDCALAIDEFSINFIKKQAEQGIEFGITRIGVNTGLAIIGNFGGADRFDYTAHGDAINTAARLESVNKQLGTRICISETTKTLCHTTHFRNVGGLILKGKTKPVFVFEPVSEETTQSQQFKDYEKAYAMIEQDDPSVSAILQDLHSRYPDDPLVTYHAQRYNQGDQGAIITLSEK